MNQTFTRREMLAQGGLSVTASMAAGRTAMAEDAGRTPQADEPFRYCLNTGTIRGHELTLEREVEVTAQAGYSGIEPWISSLRKHKGEGRSLSDLRKRIADLGLTVEGAIGFAAWAAEDEAQRAKGVAELKSDMELVAEIGGRRIAAPPAGINRTSGLDLNKIAERYRVVLEMGRQMGVLPQLEIWGTALTLGKVSEAAHVAIQARHPDACLLLDVYHMFRGDSGFDGLRLLNGAAMHVLHVNDYPADPPREQLTDAHRVYPGDGVAPLGAIFRTLRDSGFRGALSLELFNRDYWKQDPLTVARTGLEKTRAAVRKALR
jgi:sugar phosphate isomerase/epimerase